MTGLRRISESDWSDRPPPRDILQAIQKQSIRTQASTEAMWVSDMCSPTLTAKDLLLIQQYEGSAFGYTDYVPLYHPLLGFSYKSSWTTVIGDFPGEPYRTLNPISVTLEQTGDEYLARFQEANIAMTGRTESEALGNLAADILDTYELYSAEEAHLGPEPAKQLATLRRYIVEC